MYLRLFLLFLFMLTVNGENEVVKGDARIIGGKGATRPYPYQVSIQLYYYDDWHHNCGGSIISDRYILTAGHCVMGENKDYTPNDELSILAGTQQLDRGGTRYETCKSIAHPNYLTQGSPFDIALIKVKGTIKFVSTKIAPIKYNKMDVEDGISCVLTGWGRMTGNYGDGKLPTELQELHTSTVHNKKCPKSYVNNICTLSRKGEGACDGDSGGPLVDINKDIQIGVASQVSEEGCAKGDPDYFIKVANFYDWIQQNTRS